MDIETKLKEVGVELPGPRTPMANYVGAVTAGDLVFVSGHGPSKPGGGVVTGKLGRDLEVKDGYEAARLCAIQCLTSLRAEIGDLARVKRIVKLLGMVNCTEDFAEHPQVMNGASDLLVAVFGDAGKHARSAVGMQMLPSNIAVEVEMVVQLHG